MVTKLAAVFACAAVAVSFAAAPAEALTKKEKQDTCTFGADHQKLTGAKRKAFMAKCMSNRNDPRGAAQSEKKN